MSDVIVIKGMHGLGDELFQMPIIFELLKEYETIWLSSSWPQIYLEHPKYDPNRIKFFYPQTTLRTQLKNVAKYSYMYQIPPQIPPVYMSYVPFPGPDLPVSKALLKSIQKEHYNYFLDLPIRRDTKSKIAIIRPCTIRQEWRVDSRNPDPVYIQEAVDFCNSLGLKTVVVADIEEGKEWYEDRPLRASAYYEKGEIDVLDIAKKASLIIGGIGFIVPLCIACDIPNLIIGGGCGYYNNPTRLFVKGRGIINYIGPEPLCMCKEYHHNCNKHIDKKRFEEALLCCGKMVMPI